MKHEREQTTAEPGKLKRDISFGPLLLLAINAIIGTGIFFVPAIAASIAGPTSLISWIIVALIAIFIAMCFAELTGMYPKCGGVYEFAKNAFGTGTGFVVGWIGWIVANITIAMLVVGSFDYLSTIVPLTSTQILIASMVFVILMNFVSTRGINMSIKVLLLFAVITIMSLWILISWGVYHINVQHINPITIFIFPASAVLFAMVFILETFFGWETVTYLAEETKDAKKQIPRVMIFGTIAVVLLALGVIVVALGVLPWQVLAQSTSPLVDAAFTFVGPSGAAIIAILVFLNIMGTAAAWIISTPRLIFALARDRLLPPVFSKVHKRFQTPVNAIILQTILTTFIITSGSYVTLLKILLPLAIIMYSVVILCIPKLRFSKPNVKRTFKVPLGKVLPILIVIFLLFLITYINLRFVILGYFFVLIGIPLYLSMALQFNPRLSEEFADMSTFITHHTYNYLTPKKLKRRVFKHLGNLKNKVVMDFGCSIGTLSIDLAKLVGKKGRVHATEVSHKRLKLAKKLAKKAGVHDTIVFTQENAGKRHKLHKNIKDLDAFVSIGTLGYLQNPDKVLKEVNKRLKPGAKIYFVDYDHLFQFIPTRCWLENDNKIKEKFESYGFVVEVYREKKILWELLHIYGVKKKR